MSDVMLGDVTDLILDGTHGSPVRTETGVPVLSAQNVRDGRLLYDTDRFTSIAEYDIFARRLRIQEGDVLLTIVGTIGRAAVIDEVRPTVFQRSVAVLRPKKTLLDGQFLYHIMSSPGFQAQLRSATNKSSQAGVYLGKLKQLHIPLPPLAAQRRIANVLDHADDMRRKRHAALVQLDALTESIFLDLFGDPVSNARQWPTDVRLEDVADIVSGVTKGRKLNGATTRNVPYLAVSNVQHARLALEVVKEIAATESEITRYRLQQDDLLLTEGGDPDKLGRGTLWNNELPECIHQNHIFRVRLKSARVTPLFLSTLIGSAHGKQYFLKSAKQTTGIASINMTQLRAFPLALPPIELQRAFGTRVSQAMKLRLGTQRSQECFENLFQSLRHRAFRGEL